MFWKTTMFDKRCKSYFIKLLLKYSFDFNIFFCLCFKLRLKLVGTLSKRGLSYSQVNHLFLVHLNAVLLGCSTSVTVFLCSCFRKALQKSIKHSGNRLKTHTNTQNGSWGKRNGSRNTKTQRKCFGGRYEWRNSSRIQKCVKDCSETHFKDVEDSLVLWAREK